MSSRSALKYRFASYSIKYASSLVFPIAIAKTYGPIVNGDVQLLIAATSYLGLLDSGMSINALNRGGTSSGSLQEEARNTFLHQLNSSKQIFLIGICIASVLLLFASWNHVISANLLFAGSILVAIAILEIAVTPFKYHLYSHGLAGTVEKREAWMSTLSTFALLTWSLLILAGFLPLMIGLPIGLVLIRSDRVSSGLASLRDLLSIANLSVNKISLKHAVQYSADFRHNHFNHSNDRIWIVSLQVLSLLNWSADTFLIRFFIGASAVSDYSIFSKFFMIPAAITALAYPVIQSNVNNGKLSYRQFTFMVNWSLPFIAFSSISIILVAKEIFSLFPFVSLKIGLTGLPSLLLLSSFGFLSMLSVVSGFYGPVANGLHLFKYSVIISIVFLPSNIILSWILGVHFGLGVAGVVGATCITMLFTSCLIMPRKILKWLPKV